MGSEDENSHQSSPDSEKDVFRDTPIRYLGYANELGEAFRSFVHVNIVRASYAVSSCYVVADAAHKGRLASRKFDGRDCKRRMITQAVADTLIWQGLASVAIPGFTINRICWLSTKLLSRSLPLAASKGLSTAIGLAAIPLIIKPIDRGVDTFMEVTFRKYFDHVDEFDKQKVFHHTRDD